ncbi:sensor histidine kinase [Microbacterium sp. NPDC058389]|uniref:sensor histidine kinase n=1 Tax=Microbacterium sp. NPDC058389 TaxID=3346475 RepID=UPI003654F0AD
MTGSEGAKPGISDPRPRIPHVVSDLIVAAIVLLVTFAPSPGDAYAPPEPLTIVLAVVAAAVLPVRRRLPIPTLAAVVVLFGLDLFTGMPSPGLAFAVAVGMFGVTNRLSRGTGFVATAITVVVVVGLSLIATIWTGWDPRVIQFGLTVVIGAAVGDANRSRRDFIAAMTERAERAEQTREAEAQRRVSEERLRIARDLHDAVAHQISVISLNAGVASSAIDTRPDRAKEALATIRSAARTVLGEIGTLLEVLRATDEGTDGEPGRAAPPQPTLEQLDELVQTFGASGLDVTVRTEGDLAGVPGAQSRVAYRVMQEALTNAHKHGAEHRAHVLVTVEPDVLTVVVTNPVADLPGAAAPGSRLGLTGLRERVASVRGTVETGPATGGWRLVARLPLTDPAAAPAAAPPAAPRGEAPA